MKRLVGLLAGVVGVLLFVASGLVIPEWMRLHDRADAVLGRYAAAVAATDVSPSFAIVSDRTRQVGDWELDVGGNNKMALIAGVIEPAAPLPTGSVGSGIVSWSGGRSQNVRLISAVEALEEIREEAVQPCPECRPLRVVDARLTSQPTETSLGPAEVPVWEFTLEGTAVRVTRVALAARMLPALQPMDPTGTYTIPIDAAHVSSDGRRLRVDFVGGPGPDQGGWSVDYWAEAVESASAVAVVIRQIPTIRSLFPHTAEGHFRTAEVPLGRPLGDRAVLEISGGMPVRVSR